MGATRRGGNRKWVLSLALALCAVAAASCANRQEAHFRRMADDRFSAREQPAEVRAGPARDLAGEGYLLVGYVDVHQLIRACDGTACWDYVYEQTPTEEARRLAAERGGDLILLEKQDESERIVEEREGSCKEPNIRGPIAPRRPMLTDDCLEYEVKVYMRESRVAKGFVWRLEPERAERHNARLREKLFGLGKAAESP